MGNMISEKLSNQINQTVFHVFPLYEFFWRETLSVVSRSEIEVHQLLCLVEPWNIFFTVTQVHETGIPFSVFSTLNNFLDFSPLTGFQYNYFHSCDHLIAVTHAALTGMHPAAGLRLHGRPQATVAMQLERKQSDSRTLLHPGPTIVH